ncbi:hypothetical protein EU95_0547 [Prochlorococcus marinus str. MIT 9201]|uniref:Right handed beta helix domain-containing protein n=1 Tax=Prochlorococcus marinus str. MIT 9201 TaxID=93057 RepID=A0A0A2A461_PROMR|nr:hypothetical protein [Prochlorococcus marinus]KGF96662.1 hypothetical protein EU95_0547 [Prochlorococcus marinus str. MIT 9201]
MKKAYLIFLLSGCFSVLLLSFFNHRNKLSVLKENINNLDQLIDDSIRPHCSFEFNGISNNSINYFKKLVITIPESRRWSINLLKAFNEDSKIIKEKYKKRFAANIAFKKSNGKTCQLPAKVRISGDWKDHIQSKKGDVISSLDVTLTEGNINGITKFKLFIPSTRNRSSEVIVSLLMKEMGYLSPRTKMTKVSLNDKTFEMIFQEKAVKEMLENNKLRESAIIEADESLMWEIRSGNGPSSNGNIFPRIVNKEWIKRNSINQRIGLEGSNIFSKAILESWNHAGNDKEITFSDLLLSNGDIKSKRILSRYKAHLISSGTTHALYNHNRRFYYDPISKSLLPIYYDGDSKVKNLEKEFNFTKDFKDRFLTRDIETEDFNRAINEIKQINLTSFSLKLKINGVKLKDSELKNIKEQLIRNLIYLRDSNKINLKTKFKDNPLIRKFHNNENYGLALYSQKDSNFYLCSIEEKICNKKNLNSFELNKLLVGDYLKDNLKYYFIGDKFDPIKKRYYDNVPNNLNLINPIKNIYIKKFGNPKLTIDKKKKLISIIFKNFDEKILFTNSKLDGWYIKVFANADNTFKPSKSRIDNNLLTSLITIKDSNVKNLKIHIDGGQHEDSLNIMNSFGSIDELVIKNSFQDAIDFDFSDLKVNMINVQNSGNDCIDTSAGKYFIKNINLDGCKDKGVSVGEESYLRVLNAEIKNSNIALVSKDFSKLIVNNAYLENNSICAAAYNKKKEFGPSYIAIPTKSCPKGKLAIQNKSILEKK